MRSRLALLAMLGLATPAVAQQQATRALTAADYAQAERFLSANTNPLVFGATVRPTWLDDDRLWYRNTIPEGGEFILANPGAGTRERAFDPGTVPNQWLPQLRSPHGRNAARLAEKSPQGSVPLSPLVLNVARQSLNVKSIRLRRQTQSEPNKSN